MPGPFIWTRHGNETSRRWVIDSADAQSIVSTRREIATHITKESRGNADAFMVELITGEILAAEWSRHAGAIAVEVEWQNDNAILDVYDQGPELDLSQVVDPMDQPADMMLRRFADALTIEHTIRAITSGSLFPHVENQERRQAGGYGSLPPPSSGIEARKSAARPSADTACGARPR